MDFGDSPNDFFNIPYYTCCVSFRNVICILKEGDNARVKKMGKPLRANILVLEVISFVVILSIPFTDSLHPLPV